MYVLASDIPPFLKYHFELFLPIPGQIAALCSFAAPASQRGSYLICHTILCTGSRSDYVSDSTYPLTNGCWHV
jgi:hypothetical protein